MSRKLSVGLFGFFKAKTAFPWSISFQERREYVHVGSGKNLRRYAFLHRCKPGFTILGKPVHRMRWTHVYDGLAKRQTMEMHRDALKQVLKMLEKSVLSPLEGERQSEGYFPSSVLPGFPPSPRPSPVKGEGAE